MLLSSGYYLVRGGVSLAHRLSISTLVVGVVVVSFGTSAPEFFVSLTAALGGQPDISVGNVVGSNISNIGLVLGITAIIMPISVKQATLKYDGPVMILSGVLLIIFGRSSALLDWWEGLLFCFILAAFVIFTITHSRKRKVAMKIVKAKYSLWVSLVIILGSSIGLMFGSGLLVKGAEKLAFDFGVSERVISISVIAVGTSIPELVTSIIAAARKEMDISIGNIIGSNIYNTLGILGFSAAVKPLELNSAILSSDLWWMMGFFVVLYLFIFPFKTGYLRRSEGVLFLVAYVFYIYMVFN